MKLVRIGTRASKLAVIQAELLRSYLKQNAPEVQAELVTMHTTGDRIQDRALDKIGGKGLFVKELDQALLEHRSDLSVHSLKDVPMELPDALPLLGYSRREDPRDALVLPEGKTELDFTKPIGCGSSRRIVQLRRLFPQAVFAPIRGNVQTRLRKLDEGQYGATVLAVAGLKRSGLEQRISRIFSPEELLPAAGQGILAVQGRAGEKHLYLSGFFDPDSRDAALCERAFVSRLGGGCSAPTAAYAELDGENNLRLTGLYVDEKSGEPCVRRLSGPREQAEALGKALAEEFLRGTE